MNIEIYILRGGATQKSPNNNVELFTSQLWKINTIAHIFPRIATNMFTKGIKINSSPKKAATLFIKHDPKY